MVSKEMSSHKGGAMTRLCKGIYDRLSLLTCNNFKRKYKNRKRGVYINLNNTSEKRRDGESVKERERERER